LDADDDDGADQGDLKKLAGASAPARRMDQALESQWIAGARQLGAEFFNGIDPKRSHE
jgi:hypothetical protein